MAATIDSSYPGCTNTIPNTSTADFRRWPRHGQPIAGVTLNPERDSVVNAALKAQRELTSFA
jgi:hypothetical protein